MKSAIIYAPDWPEDEIVLVMEPIEAELIIDLLQKAHRGSIGGQIVAVLDRTWFRVLERQVSHRVADAAPRTPEYLAALRALEKAFDRAAASLHRAQMADMPRTGAAPASHLAASLKA